MVGTLTRVTPVLLPEYHSLRIALSGCVSVIVSNSAFMFKKN